MPEVCIDEVCSRESSPTEAPVRHVRRVRFDLPPLSPEPLGFDLPSVSDEVFLQDPGSHISPSSPALGLYPLSSAESPVLTSSYDQPDQVHLQEIYFFNI